MKEQEDIDLIIVNCGSFRIDYQKTANIITTDKIESNKIINQLKDNKSEYYRLYKLGQDKAEYSIMEKLFSLSQAGDIQALKEYDKRVLKNKMR